MPYIIVKITTIVSEHLQFGGRAAEAELADAQPLPGNAYKVPLARNVLVRTLLDPTEEEERR